MRPEDTPGSLHLGWDNRSTACAAEHRDTAQQGAVPRQRRLDGPATVAGRRRSGVARCARRRGDHLAHRPRKLGPPHAAANHDARATTLPGSSRSLRIVSLVEGTAQVGVVEDAAMVVGRILDNADRRDSLRPRASTVSKGCRRTVASSPLRRRSGRSGCPSRRSRSSQQVRHQGNAIGRSDSPSDDAGHRGPHRLGDEPDVDIV